MLLALVCLTLEQMADPNNPLRAWACGVRPCEIDGASAPSSTTQAVSQVVQMLEIERARNMCTSVKGQILPVDGLDQGYPRLGRWRMV